MAIIAIKEMKKIKINYKIINLNSLKVLLRVVINVKVYLLRLDFDQT